MSGLMGAARSFYRRWRRRRESVIAEARAVLGGVPLTAVDVGAAAGLLTHWETLDGVAHIYSVEPDEEAAAALEREHASGPNRVLHTVVRAGLSGAGGPRTLHVSNVPTGASLLPLADGPQREYIDRSYQYPCREVPIATRTLADVLDEHGVASADLVKLDIQGAELEVLESMGEKRLSELLAVELEVNLQGAYSGQPSLEDVHRRLSKSGMELFDLRTHRAYRTKDGSATAYHTDVFRVAPGSPSIAGRIWEVDAVFFRDPRPLLAARRVDAVRKLAVAYCVYRYFSEAYHLIEQARASGLLDGAAAAECHRAIVTWHDRLCWPFWEGTSPVMRALRVAARALKIGRRWRWAQYIWVEYPGG